MQLNAVALNDNNYYFNCSIYSNDNDNETKTSIGSQHIYNITKLMYFLDDGNSDDDFGSPCSPLLPLKDVVIPSGFLLPDFHEESCREKEVDIFSYGPQTIKGKWMNTARNFIRGLTGLESDRFACISTKCTHDAIVSL